MSNQFRKTNYILNNKTPLREEGKVVFTFIYARDLIYETNPDNDKVTIVDDEFLDINKNGLELPNINQVLIACPELADWLLILPEMRFSLYDPSMLDFTGEYRGTITYNSIIYNQNYVNLFGIDCNPSSPSDITEEHVLIETKLGGYKFPIHKDHLALLKDEIVFLEKGSKLLSL